MKRLYVSILMILGLSWSILGSIPALALTPPWDEKELKQGSDLILHGEIKSPVRCISLIKKTDCFDLFEFSVPLKVTRITKALKGKAPHSETLELHFYHYDYSKSHCTGNQDTPHFPGEKGTYYLRKTEDGFWQKVHWNGVTVTQEGAGKLPACP